MLQKNRKKKSEVSIFTFTLMEVLVASCLLGIFLGVLLSGFSTAMRDAEIAGNYTTAIYLANLKFNELISRKTFKEKSESGTFENDFRDFQWCTQVNKKSAASDWWLIKVEISFGTGTSARTFSLSSMVIEKKSPKKPNTKKKK